MKKILISILIILLLVLCYFALAKGIGFLKIKSINNIKEASNKLDNDFNEANELSNKTYPSEAEGLEEAVKQLKLAKQQYENKSSYTSEENMLGTVQVKTYKIHYLWTILGNYRKDRGIQSLNLDLKSTQGQDIYDLEFTLIGSYTNITDFLYDIENDEELNFEIQGFNISSSTEKTNSNTNSNTNNDANKQENNNTNSDANKQENNNNQQSELPKDGVTLQAKFTVENVGITLD